MKASRFYILFYIYIFLFNNYFLLSQNNKNSNNLSYKSILDTITKYHKSDPTHAISYAKKYIQKAKNTRNKIYEFNGYHLLEIIYYENNNLDKALETSNFYLEFSKKNNLKEELLKAYLLRSSLIIEKYGLGDLSVLENFKKGLNTAKKFNDEVWICIFLNKISEFHFYAGNYNKAIKLEKNIISKIKKIKEFSDKETLKIWGLDLAIAYDNIIESYLKIKNTDSLKHYNTLYKNHITKITKQKDYYEQKYYLNKGEIDLLKRDFKSAENNFNSAFNCVLDTTKNQIIIRQYYSGKIAFFKKEYKKAIQYFKKIDLSEITLNNKYLYDFYKYFSKAYLYNTNYKKANYYFEKHLATLDIRNKISNNINLEFKKIEIEEYKKELKIVREKKQNQKNIFIVSSILLLMLLIFFIYYFYLQKKKNKLKFNKLIKKIETLEESLKPITKVKRKLNIKKTEIKKILSNISKLEKEKFYLKTRCSLSTMSKKAHTNNNYLSKIINHYYQKSFTDYINNLRINYVIIRIKDDKFFRLYSIQSIANEVGFKSKESFNNAFKKHTGLLPSYFIKEIEKIKKQN